MIHHQLAIDPDAPLVGGLDELGEVLEGPVVRIHRAVIGDVIAGVAVGRGVEGAEHDGAHAQGGDVVHLLRYPAQVTDPVPVRVVKAAHPDLVEDHVPVPLGARKVPPLQGALLAARESTCQRQAGRHEGQRPDMSRS